MTLMTGKSPNQVDPVAAPLVSVIIPVRNEERVIGQCLESLQKNGFPRKDFEIIVVDNGSTDRTLELVQIFTSSLRLRVLRHTNVYISALRNRGAEIARGDILAFLDADCLAPADWLSNAVAAFSDSKAGVVGAHYQIPTDSTWVGRVWYENRMAARVGDVRYVPSGDLLVRRDSFFRVGSFDESIQTNEDFEFCQRAISAGLSVRSHPNLQVIHLGTPRTVAVFYKKQRWHGTHVLKVFLRDPQKRRNLRPVLFSIYTLMCLLGVALSIPTGVVSGVWEVAAFPVLLLLLPPFLMAFTRSVGHKQKTRDIPKLFLLYLVFGLARAACVLDSVGRRLLTCSPKSAQN